MGLRMVEKNKRQRRFSDAVRLQKAGITVSTRDLAQATGSDERDLEGILVAQDSPALRAVTQGRERRLVRMSGMGDNDGGTIGFALLVEDIKKLFAKFRKK